MSRFVGLIVFVVVVAQWAPALRAEWPDDPAVNLVIGDRPDMQAQPKVAATPDGGCYIGWIDPASGNYDTYLQRLDAAGNVQWAHNGLLISGHPQMSMLTDWCLVADAAGNAVLTFSDLRDGDTQPDIQAYKVGPGGEMLWGPDGVSLSSNEDGEALPLVVEATDGALVFVWSRERPSLEAWVMMQRLSPGGVPQFAFGGLPIVRGEEEAPLAVDLAASDDGAVIVAWLSDTTTPCSPRLLRAGKFSSTGGNLWDDAVEVCDAAPVPMARHPEVHSDGQGGALLVWDLFMAGCPSLFDSYAQHLDSTGAELFPHNGVALSIIPYRYHYYPTLAYNQDTGESFAFWVETDTAADKEGIYAQKLSADGVRMWGDAGRIVVPAGPTSKQTPVAMPFGSGVLAFLIQELADDRGPQELIGLWLNGEGEMMWSPEAVPVSSPCPSKRNLSGAIGPDGVVKLAWEDGRNGMDIYAQNVNPNGTLGLPGPPSGDFDDDGDVDLADLAGYAECLAGPGLPPDPAEPITAWACRAAFDFDGDGDVDVCDFGGFQEAFSPED